MDQKKLFEILKNGILSWKGELIIFIVLFLVDFTLTRPLYIYVFDLPDLAPFLSGGMALVYMVIAKACSRSLARHLMKIFYAGISLFLCLMIFAFIGQEVAAEIAAADPFAFLTTEGVQQEEHGSNRHYVAVGLSTVLFALAVYVGYLVALGEEEVKPHEKDLSISGLERGSLSEITILQGEADRAENKPISLAEQKVNDRLQNLHSKLNEYTKTERQLQGEQNYQLQLLDIMQRQTLHAIERVYKTKKSFIQRIFS
ncbi:MAG: hypothetical protein AAGA64_12290 [Bacteroidota bacterium]